MRRFIILAAAIIVLTTVGWVAAQTVHTVQRGETLYRIARQYGATIEAIKQANSLLNDVIHAGQQLVIPGASGSAPAASPPAAPSAPAVATGSYTVRPGDSLASIASAFNTNYLTLAEMNGLPNPDVLYVGQVIHVPAAPSAPAAGSPAAAPSAPAAATGTYVVRPGDSLASIASAFNTNYLTLAEMNGLPNPDILTVGQVLRVPAPPTPAEAPPPAASSPPAAAPPPSSAPTSGFELGGQALSFSQPGHMHSARMTWVKRQVKWHGEPASNFQHVINSAKSNGFKVLLSVIGDHHQIASNPGQYYQNFANFLAGLAAGGADAIEVWNEMNIDREWPAGSISGANYTQMLSAAYRAIKAANPATMVISGAPAPTGYFQGCSTSGGDDDCYIRQMAAAGAAQFMDCVGIHYNAGITSPNATSGAPVGSSGHYSWYYPRMVSLYRSVFPGKPLCFTEIGYLTGEGIGPLPSGFAWASGISLAQQAAWLAEAVTRARNSGAVRLFIVWNVDATLFGADPQAGYAIVRPNNSCPACNSLRLAMGG